MHSEGPFNRYYKFQWASVEAVPPVGKLDYVPKGGSRTSWATGSFVANESLFFDETKQRHTNIAVEGCIFCNQAVGPFTDEDIIPEALGADAFVKSATCRKCQDITSRIESQIFDGIFFHVRKHLSLKGKNKRSGKDSAKLDLGFRTSSLKSVKLNLFPTMLMMPRFDPASSFSRRPIGSGSRIDWLVFNLNCTEESLRGIHSGSFAIAILDSVSFSQFICKIALTFAASKGFAKFQESKIAKFISRKFEKEDAYQNQFDCMGCISPEMEKSESLHELQLGTMFWQGKENLAVKVRLFAKFGMPSYYVTFN